MPPLDLNNPLVVLLVIVAVVLLFDVMLAGGGMTAGAACGMASAMSTPVGWLALLLVAVMLWAFLTGGLPTRSVLVP